MSPNRVRIYAYEQNYVALLHRDLLRESPDLFPENEGVVLEAQLMSRRQRRKRVDLVLKYGSKLIGIEMKAWPPFDEGYEKAVKYSRYFDMTFLAVPVEYVRYAVSIRKDYPEIGLLTVSLNTGSTVVFPGELSRTTSAVKEDILFDYFWYGVTSLDDEKLENYYRSKVWQGIKKIFDHRITSFNAYLTLSALANVYSPIKYFDYYEKLTSSMNELIGAEKNKWPSARALQFLGLVEVYQWGPLRWKEAYFRINPFAFVALRRKFNAYLKEREIYDFYREWIKKKKSDIKKVQNDFLSSLMV